MRSPNDEAARGDPRFDRAACLPELWQAAQDTLDRNRTIARNTRRHYLLRSVIRCASCTLVFVGTQGRPGVGWYRCGGKAPDRGPLGARCATPLVRADALEPTVWADIERWLRDPGDVLTDLETERQLDIQGAIAEVETITFATALNSLDAQRKQVLALSIRGRLQDAELDAELDRIAVERTAIHDRIGALRAAKGSFPSPETIDLLAEVCRRLDEGLTIEQRQEIVRLLASICIHTDERPDGKRAARAVIEYRFPGVVETRTGTREGLNYTIRQRVIELPPSRYRARPIDVAV